MVKLDRLINILGGYGARLIGAASARDIEVRSVSMHDPTAPAPAIADAFLAVGVSELSHAVALAARAQSVVVLVRDHADIPVSAAPEGIALLLIEPGVSWSHIAEVVYGLVFEGRETEAGRGPSDLFALADTVAAALGAPVTIEDARSRVLAYSGLQHETDTARQDTILGRRVPEPVRELFEQRGVFAHLATSDTPLFVAPSPENGLRGRMAVAVRAGRELLGSLWITCDAPLSEARARVLTESADTVALHLLRSRVSADLERQVESELVIQLLEGTPDVTAVFGKLGLPPGECRVIALQAHAHGEQHAAILLAYERATTGFGWSRPGRSTLFGNTVYTVLPTSGNPEPAQEWLREIIASLPDHVVVAAGVGGPATLTQLPNSRQEADECLALHATDHRQPPRSYDESWDEILLQRLRTAATAGRIPTRSPLAELSRYDQTGNTRYLTTLRAWLETQGDLVATAARLRVHPNTVRYRMRKMHEITDLRLDDPRKRLAMLITLAIDV
ncbi:DNA-binding PucR family transcriptional regulator [Tamaricihabitans halophyticus]|uniref:DNA-binding PucR family transcriptional regulator n=1 Tax=Tamaricihabitans halophyticus TaxID=1262583 RepID=A0A4V2SSR0_9PSEU|nr:PucR family transcriptional regulator [Tamaricihabitans halophyticus]TCP47816.1 DNA-binding PucR family transcriptional regulator [Tamaricihabitans halophyticus]